MSLPENAEPIRNAKAILMSVPLAAGMLLGGLAAFKAREEAVSLAARASLSAAGQGALRGALAVLNDLPEGAAMAFGGVADHLEMIIASRTTDPRPVAKIVRRFVSVEAEEKVRALEELKAAGIDLINKDEG